MQDNMLDKKHKIKIIGRREFVAFPLLRIDKVEAKIDTGAYTCAIHCNDIVLKTINEKQILTFRLFNNTIYQVDEFTRKKIKNSFGEMEERYIIKTTISLSDRGNMRYPVLIGRRLLKGKFIIDVNLIYTNGLHLNTLLK
jgi:hypothetical protein